MKLITMQILYPKLEIVNGSITYLKNISLANVEWIQKDVMMLPPSIFLTILINSLKSM
jgi:hypothetical protein